MVDALLEPVVDMMDDETAKAAKEARKDFQDEDHHGMVLYRQYMKRLYEEGDDDFLTPEQRSSLKKFLVSAKKMIDASGYTMDDVNKKQEEVQGAKQDLLIDVLDAVFDLDKETEEAIRERTETVNRHPGRAVYKKLSDEYEAPQWTPRS
jgi:hypothetical protein